MDENVRQVNKGLRRRVFARDGYTCRYCGCKEGPLHADHVYPHSKGGVTAIDNLVTACEHCNISKHNKLGIYPKPIGYFDERQKMTKEITEQASAENQELKVGGSFAVTFLFFGGLMTALTLVLPVEVVGPTERLFVYALFGLSVLVAGRWVASSLRS